MSLSSEKEDFCSRQQLEATKLRRLNSMFAEVLPANNFYREKLSGCKTPVQSLDELSDFPWTIKSDLVGNVDTVSAQNRTWSDEHYVRFHQTSGTSGRPLQIWDTQADWEWWMTCWEFIYSRACLQPGEPVFIAASFGPYIGFWSAFEGAVASGGRAIPSGGLSSIARLELLQKTEAKVLVATPTYALHWQKLQRSMDTTHPDRLSVALSLLVNPAGHWIQCGIGWPLLGGLMYWTIPARQRLDRGAWGGCNIRGLRSWKNGFIQSSVRSRQTDQRGRVNWLNWY